MQNKIVYHDFMKRDYVATMRKVSRRSFGGLNSYPCSNLQG